MDPPGKKPSKARRDWQRSRVGAGADNATGNEYDRETKSLNWNEWNKDSRRRVHSSSKSKTRRVCFKDAHRSENDEHPSNNNRKTNDYENPASYKDEALLANLLDHLREFLAEGMNADTVIDVQKARNVLEASAGNIPLSAQLYWDDYFASQANDHHSSSNNNHANFNNNYAENNPKEGVGEAAVEVQQREKKQNRGTRKYNDNSNDEDRRVRRRLENDFERMRNAAAARGDDNRGNQQQQQDQVAAPDVHVVLVAAQAGVNYDGKVDGENIAGAAAAARAAESVSVSDDDSGGVAAGFKRIGRIAAQPEDFNSPLSGRRSNDNQDPSKQSNHSNHSNDKKRDANSSENDDNDEFRDDGYLSDDDWIWARSVASLRAPMEILWGCKRGNNPATSNAEESETGGFVIADDEGENCSTSRSGIPSTWLHAGFTPDACAHGIVVKSPREEDIAMYNWRQNSAGGREVSVPRPYHCRAISGVLSIVTALLYTGASIKSNQITCFSSRKPYVELTTEEKKREFESRLADSLSALLFVAAQVSVERKKRALESRKSGWDLSIENNPQKLQRKLGLCPTCWWEEDTNTGEFRLPAGRDEGRNIRLIDSLTNIKDLRAYVLSNMRSFTSPGGCALFLETILNIHGKGAVSRMMRRSRRQAGKKNHNGSLIACTCEERQKKLLNDDPPHPRTRKIKTLDTSPPGHDCLTIELLSLIITGKVFSTFHGWSAGSLGFGILPKKVGGVAKALCRPEKPVWLLRGETCYSVMWLNSNKMYHDAANFSTQNAPGFVANLTHWNCWYGQRNKSGLQLICAGNAWSIPLPLKASRAKNASRLLSADSKDSKEDEVSDCEKNEVTEDEMDRLRTHPEDVIFYPSKYRFWRFDMGEAPGENLEKKKRGMRWVPYHSLLNRQKLIVEMKLGPKINRILWTRWPNATIEKFTPKDEHLPIV